ncbi:MAG: hypothetical protein ACYSUQ_02280 [Planctomycetota bacterium]|jgi:hypothetical protein
MSDRPLVAHSLAEVYLYLMVTPCGQCGRGPLRGDEAQPFQKNAETGVAVDVVCGSCEDRQELRFELPADELAAAKAAPPDSAARINTGLEPSLIIDVAGWVTLFRVIADAAVETKDKIEARKLGYEAAQCLEEGLKFYEQDNDLPPETAFFSKASRRLHREHPQRLARSRLINLRAKLPTLDAMEKQLAASRGQRSPWWRRRRKTDPSG